jgi:O-succinylbenzoic acid--CoA ligase
MSLSIFDAARDSADREALVCQNKRLSFSALADRVAPRCEELAKLGVRPLSRHPVALVVDGSLAMFELLYALFALGIPVLPLHPRLTPPERAFLCDSSRAGLLVDPSRVEPVASAPSQWPEPTPIPEQQALAFVPSSGSSGAPKLARLSRRAFVALARADAERVPPLASDRALLCLPLSHVGGLSVVTRSLLARRTCVVFGAHSGGLLHAAAELGHALVAERISLLSLVPPVLARLLREVPAFGSNSQLRALLLGGQACNPELFAEARDRNVPVLTSYGLTETCSQVSTLRFPPPARAPSHSGVLSSGFPLSGVEVRVRSGLIEVRGSTLFSGYDGAPSALDADGFFHTGDRGELDSELGLFVFGRASELIVTGGENVDPSEVEHALLASGGLEAACVFGVPDTDFGARVAAALEPQPGRTRDERALFSALDQRLASFKQPRALCWFDELPRLPSGKLDRARIRSEAMARLRAPARG